MHQKELTGFWIWLGIYFIFVCVSLKLNHFRVWDTFCQHHKTKEFFQRTVYKRQSSLLDNITILTTSQEMLSKVHRCVCWEEKTVINYSWWSLLFSANEPQMTYALNLAICVSNRCLWEKKVIMFDTYSHTNWKCWILWHRYSISSAT